MSEDSFARLLERKRAYVADKSDLEARGWLVLQAQQGMKVEGLNSFFGQVAYIVEEGLWRDYVDPLRGRQRFVTFRDFASEVMHFTDGYLETVTAVERTSGPWVVQRAWNGEEFG